MASYDYAVTKQGDTWRIVNRRSRSQISGPYSTQSDAEDAAESRARNRAGQGHTVRVYVEDEDGEERLRNKYDPPKPNT